eukprot:78639_1
MAISISFSYLFLCRRTMYETLYETFTQSYIATANTKLELEDRITLYVYKTNFSNIYKAHFNKCEAPHPFRTFQHLPDFYFFNDISSGTLNVNVATSIEELEAYPLSKQIIFVVPIWNDVLTAMSRVGHAKEINECVKQHVDPVLQSLYTNDSQSISDIHKRLMIDVATELRYKMSEFTDYITLHPMISYRYITIFHAWWYARRAWEEPYSLVHPLYVHNNMSIVHYEKNVFEAGFGKSKLHGYKHIIVAPYVSSLFSLPSPDMDDTDIVNDLYFRGGLRSRMLGGLLRINACQLNQMRQWRVNVNYLKVSKNTLKSLTLKNMNWTHDEYKKAKDCIRDNYNNSLDDRMYLNDLKQSRFCLFFRGDTYSARRFYDIVYANCIPIIVADKWLSNAAPFRSVIDYHKMCYFINESAFNRHPIYEISKVLKLEKSKWNMKLQYLKQNKHHLIWTNDGSKVTHNIILSLFN